MTHETLTDWDRRTHEWQMWAPEFGEAGQHKLKNATVLVTRVGGVGSAAAYYLAAAGVGRLILAHGGNVRQSDLNRQILMTQDWVGKPRIECAARRLRELNPALEIMTEPENISDSNAARLVGEATVVVDCAPLFAERFAVNRAAVAMNIPQVDCAMYDFEAQITTIVPGKTPCLACLYPTEPDAWRRQFPVFGAAAGMIGSMGAMEAIKLISGIGAPLLSTLLTCNLREMTFRKLKLKRNPECKVCASHSRIEG